MTQEKNFQQLDDIVTAISEVMIIFEEAASSPDHCIEVRADQFKMMVDEVSKMSREKEEIAQNMAPEDGQIASKYRQLTQDVVNATNTLQQVVARSRVIERKDYDTLHSSLKKILQAMVSQLQLVDALNVRSLFRLCKRKLDFIIRIKNLRHVSGIEAIRQEMLKFDQDQWIEHLNGRIQQTTNYEWTQVLSIGRDEMAKNFEKAFREANQVLSTRSIESGQMFEQTIVNLLRNLSDILYVVQKSAELIQQYGVMMDLPPLVDRAVMDFGANPEVANSLKAMERAVLNNDPKLAAEHLKSFLVHAGKQVEQGRNLAHATMDPNTKKKILQGVQGLLTVQPELVTATRKWAENPNDEQSRKNVLGLIGNAQNYNNAIEGEKPENRMEHRNLRNALAELRQGVQGPTLDRAKVTQATKDVADRIREQVAQARAAANYIDDPILRQRVNNAADELERMAPLIVAATKRVLENPNDQQARKELQALLDRADRLNNEIRKAILEDELQKNQRQLDSAMNRMRDAIKRGDKEAFEKALREVEDAIRRRIDLARKLAELEDDVMVKKELLDAADELERYLNSLRPKATTAFNNPRDARAQRELEELLSHINNAARRIDPSKATEAAEKTTVSKRIAQEKLKLDSALDELVRAVKRGDHRAAIENAKKVAESCYDQAALGRLLAQQTDDPALKKKILDAVDVLEKLPRQISEATVEALKDPKKIGQLEDLVNKAKQANKTIKDAADEIERRKNSPPKPNPRPDPNANSSRASEVFNGQPDKVMKAAHKVSDFIDQHAAPVTPEERSLFDISRKIGEEMQRLALMAREGNKTEMIASARKIAAMINEVQKLSQAISNKCTNPYLKQQLAQVSVAPANFAVQLKLICAVKDRTTKDDKSATTQLITCAEGLANSVTQTLSAAHAASLKTR